MSHNKCHCQLFPSCGSRHCRWLACTTATFKTMKIPTPMVTVGFWESYHSHSGYLRLRFSWKWELRYMFPMWSGGCSPRCSRLCQWDHYRRLRHSQSHRELKLWTDPLSKLSSCLLIKGFRFGRVFGLMKRTSNKGLAAKTSQGSI